MNLVIDYGNTMVKMAVFSEGRIIKVFGFDKNKAHRIPVVLETYPEIKNILLSAVSSHSSELIEIISRKADLFINLDHNTPLPIKNSYLTRESLGFDRIANVVGAHTIFPKKNVLVIDAGTAITYDLIKADAEFIGGNISPGIRLRAKALHHFTSKLPLVDLKNEPSLLGRSTDEAITGGIIYGVVYEMDGCIGQLKKDFNDLKVILTGGDLNYFDKKLKNSIFVDSKLNLIGLNRILVHNAA